MISPSEQSSNKRHVVSMGGGGFSETGHVTALDDYVMRLSGKDDPRVCFIPTASGDADSYISRFYSAFESAGYQATHLGLFNRGTDEEIARIIEHTDVVYVGGGNTANLLALWALHGLSPLLKKAYQRGVVMAGVSAGGLCWFEAGLTDSFGPGLKFVTNGLALIKDAFCPHFDSEALRRDRFIEELRAAGRSGWGVEDSVGLHFVDETFQTAIAVGGQRSYRFIFADGNLTQESVETLDLN